MPAPISVVIPTLNAADELPKTLASLMNGLEAGVIRELVVSDGGSGDATVRIAEDAGAEVVQGQAGRGGQLRRGVKRSKGVWVLLLHVDTQLQPGWVDAAIAHMAHHPDMAGYFRLKFRSDGLAASVVAGWANLRSRWCGLPYGDQGMLVHRDVLEVVGGVPDIPLMEDVALARSLRGRLVPLPGEAWTSAARYETDGWLRRGGRNLWTLLRFLMGEDPSHLAKGYGRRSSEN